MIRDDDENNRDDDDETDFFSLDQRDLAEGDAEASQVRLSSLCMVVVQQHR